VLIRCKTDKGRIREINEDYVLTLKSNKYCLLIAADGMGGHNGGEVASKIASTTVRNFVFDNFNSYTDKEELLRDGILKANEDTYKKSLDDEGLKGMGTTLTCCLILENWYYVGHVGDSRAYIINDKGITKITQDHSYVQQLIDNGSITESEAVNHPNRNVITRSIGTEEHVVIDTKIGGLGANDIIMLCTDGLTGYLSSSEIFDIISLKHEEAVEDLIKLANERGGSDNISVIIARKEGENE
jgi:protein phosphatase